MLAYAGRSRFVIQDLDLNPLVSETAALLSASLPKMARLELDLSPPYLGCVQILLSFAQLVMNLVINSAEAIGDRPGVIHVSTRRATPDQARAADATMQATSADNCLCLEVRDDGCGMTPEIQARIFDPFFSTKFTGRGLGLAAVVGIVRRHQGGLSVNSKPGEGSTFRIFLPALDRAAAPSRSRTPRSLKWRGEGTVLVIDDEPFICELLRTMLQGMGFQVLLAADGAEGVELMRENARAVRYLA